MLQNQPIRVFALLMLSQALSLLGSRMSALAVGLWLFAASGATTPLALAALASVLPRLLLAGPAGLAADRWDRRVVLLAAELLQAVASLLLLADLLAGTFAPWHLPALAALQATGGALQEPALQASVARLVPPAGRTRANALAQLASPLAGLLAPALAGLLLGALGVAGVVALDLLSFLLAASVLASVRFPPQAEQAQAPPATRDEWRAGLGYLAGRRDLLALLALLGLANAIFLGAHLLYPPYLLQRTGSSALTGTLLALLPAGALLGAGLVTALGQRVGARAILPALVLSGAALAAIGLSRAPLPLGVALLGLALCPAFVHAPLAALIQTSVPDRLQGRVFAAQTLLAQGLTPLVYLGLGPLVDRGLEPLVGGPGWQVVAPLVGAAPGSGMGLLLLLGGALVALLSASSIARDAAG